MIKSWVLFDGKTYAIQITNGKRTVTLGYYFKVTDFNKNSILIEFEVWSEKLKGEQCT